MTIQEAIKSKKKFRRAGYGEDYVWISNLSELGFILSNRNILEEWEVLICKECAVISSCADMIHCEWHAKEEKQPINTSAFWDPNIKSDFATPCIHDWKWMGRFKEKSSYLFKCLSCNARKEEDIEQNYLDERKKELERCKQYYEKPYTTPEEDPLGAPYLTIGGHKMKMVDEDIYKISVAPCTCGSDAISGGSHAEYCDKK